MLLDVDSQGSTLAFRATKKPVEDLGFLAVYRPQVKEYVLSNKKQRCSFAVSDSNPDFTGPLKLH